MDEIYVNELAKDYHNKRRHPWNALNEFISTIKVGDSFYKGYIVDLGCANGRNFKLFKKPENKLIGIDNSPEFLKIAKKQLEDIDLYLDRDKNSIELIHSDLKALPIRPGKINTVFSIATIHHVKGEKVREKVLFQIRELLVNQGYLCLSVWRKYQKKYRYHFLNEWVKQKISKTKLRKRDDIGIEHGDKFIPWTISSKNITFNRYYHFFSRRELVKLLRKFNIKKLVKSGGPNQKDNFFILAQKP